MKIKDVTTINSFIRMLLCPSSAELHSPFMVFQVYIKVAITEEKDIRGVQVFNEGLLQRFWRAHRPGGMGHLDRDAFALCRKSTSAPVAVRSYVKRSVGIKGDRIVGRIGRYGILIVVV